MFVRVKTTPNSPRKSVQLVESVRVDGKVKQKILRHIGIALDDDEVQRLKELGELVKAKLETQHQSSLFSPEMTARQVLEARRQQSEDEPILVDLKLLREEQRVITGIHDIYGEIYQQLGFDRVLPASRFRASNAALKDCVLARIANPDSKRATARLLEQDFGIHLPLEKIYRMMDQLDERRIDQLKTTIGTATRALLGGSLDVLFFDCTTLYFESFQEDDLKQNGYSKDCKFGQPQVLLALMVSQEGLPVSYEVFPGATFEGHSLIPVLEELKRKYSLNRVVCVADRGMLNAANLQALEAAGMHYIVGAKLKQLPQAQQQKILDKDQYQTVAGSGERRFELPHQQRRIVVSYCPKRADKDRHDREQSVQRLLKKIGKSQNPKSLLNNYGYKKFLTISGKTRLSVNEEKIAQAARWDGLHGVITNLPKKISADELFSHYRGLWQVEETFRITKHDLKIRPIYHWTPRRVRAHIAIAFMALTAVRHLSYRTALQYKRLSPQVIRNALCHVQHSVLRHKKTRKRYVIPSQFSPEAKKIYQLMGIKLSGAPYALSDD